ncbi:MAG: hypothetical protein IPJ01_12515 [Micavibrio sp.]|nr:hypothetical protein [Micavibrio sp.]
MISDHEARAADRNTHAVDVVECGRFPRILLLWAHQELARREADEAPITAEWCLSHGGTGSDHQQWFRGEYQWIKVTFYDHEQAVVCFNGSRMPHIKTVGDLQRFLYLVMGRVAT